MNRRGFFFGSAAIILTPGLLMHVQQRQIIWGDGIHDDTEALQAAIDGRAVSWKFGNDGILTRDEFGRIDLKDGKFLMSKPLQFKGAGHSVTGCWFKAVPGSAAARVSLIECDQGPLTKVPHGWTW